MVRNLSPQAGGLTPPNNLARDCLATLDQQINQLLADRPATLALNLSHVQFIDSDALNWLLDLQSRLARESIELQLRDPSPLCCDILTATRLDQRFRLVCHRSEEPRHG